MSMVFKELLPLVYYDKEVLLKSETGENLLGRLTNQPEHVSCSDEMCRSSSSTFI